MPLIAVLTGAGGHASIHSLIDRCALSDPVPCSGSERRGKVIDEVNTAISGGEAAENNLLDSFFQYQGVPRLSMSNYNFVGKSI